MDNGTLLLEAKAYITQLYEEIGYSQEQLQLRMEQIRSSIATTGTYTHTAEELQYGARLAWRNNSRCIGRLFWKSLQLLDFRHLTNEDEIFGALFQHIVEGTNEGRVRPMISVFQQESEQFKLRIWNHQLLRYAGYEREGQVIGDPTSIILTKQCEQLGWRGRGTAFDILPLVIQMNSGMPVWREIPTTIVKEVDIVHPTLDWFKELDLKWYTVPFVSDMRLELGGITYSAAPFNGWYMITEIAVRNFGDESRYHMLPAVASKMGLDISTNQSFWKDKALIALTEAVYHSFRTEKVSIVDHHTAAEQFCTFEQQEETANRKVNGRWSWLIPPLSPSATAVWHTPYTEQHMTPNYFYQEQTDNVQPLAVKQSGCPFAHKNDLL